MNDAIDTCRKLAKEHYGTTKFFDEDKMLAALRRRGFDDATATAAIITVQAE